LDRQASPLAPIRENIGERAVGPLHDEMEVLQRKALLALLQPMKRGLSQPDFLGKLGKCLPAPLFPKE